MATIVETFRPMTPSPGRIPSVIHGPGLQARVFPHREDRRLGTSHRSGSLVSVMRRKKTLPQNKQACFSIGG